MKGLVSFSAKIFAPNFYFSSYEKKPLRISKPVNHLYPDYSLYHWRPSFIPPLPICN